MGQRLDRYHGICPGFLALIEALGLGAKAQCEVRCFDKSPSQILVAVPGVAFAFLLAVAEALTIDTARIGGKVADGGKAVNWPRFQQDDGGENATNAGNAGQQGVVRSFANPLLQTLFKEVDLRARGGDDRKVAVHRQSDIRRESRWIDVTRSQALDDVAGDFFRLLAMPLPRTGSLGGSCCNGRR